MSIPKIDPYPPAPTPEDDEATFDEKAYEHAASLEVRRVQMNEVATYVNTRASDANNRAVAAAASATASSNSAARADEWANKAPGSVVAPGKYSARHYSDLSDRFANAPEDEEVEPGKYSALHWKEKAKKIADVHATTVAIDPLPTVLATNVQEALRDLAYQSDQLRIAKNQLKYGDGPYPVLDFQFQGAKLLDPRIEFTRASVDWDWDGKEYGIDEPVLTDEGLWVSGGRTSLMTWSHDLTKFTSSANCSVTENKITTTETSEGGRSFVQFTVPGFMDRENVSATVFLERIPFSGISLRVGRAYAQSVYISNEGEVVRKGGLVSYAHVEKYSDGFMVKFTGEISNPDSTQYFRVEVGDDALPSHDAGEIAVIRYIDAKEGISFTPPIPTEGSQVTVAADLAYVNNGDWYSPEAGTIFVEWQDDEISDGLTRSIAKLRTSASAQWDALGVETFAGSGGSKLVRIGVRYSAQNLNDLYTAPVISGANKAAISFSKDGLVIASFNGVIIGTGQNLAGLSSFLNRPLELHIGYGFRLSGGADAEGYYADRNIGRVTFYNRTLTDIQLTELTTL